MGYITEERIDTLRRTIVVGAKCDNCEAALDCDEEGDNCPNALPLKLIGGYGMFFDDVDVKILLCGACAHKLLEAFPSFKKQMDAQETW